VRRFICIFIDKILAEIRQSGSCRSNTAIGIEFPAVDSVGWTLARHWGEAHVDDASFHKE
jgi:hypothetical protein